SLLLAGAILAGCQSNDTGSGKEQGQELQSPAEGQEGNTLPEGGADNGEAGAENQPADPVMAKRSENALQVTIQESGGKQVVTNAEAMTVVVNKQRSLPDGYEPSDLVEPNVPFSFDEPHEKRHLRKEAADALEELF
ncbi:D-alanyl-D-alanine carboxypeptidase family protein, partial [Clostridium perfringens]